MQLKVKRSQRTGGLMGSKAIFILDVRAEPTPDESALIKKYNLGKLIVFDSKAREKHQANMEGLYDASRIDLNNVSGGIVASSLWKRTRSYASWALMHLSLSVTIESMISGHHIECKDLPELLSAEHAMTGSCQTIRDFLDIAATFDGREEVLEF